MRESVSRPTRASNILNSPTTILSPEIAASLLASVESDYEILRYHTNVMFSGPSAISVAATDPTKAEFVAAHTSDVQTQVALCDLANREDFGGVLSALARSEFVVDSDLRARIHDELLSTGKDLTRAVHICPAAHLVSWLESHPIPDNYPYQAAAKVVSMAAEPDLAVRFAKVCDSMLKGSSGSRYHVENGLSSLGEHLAKSGLLSMAVQASLVVPRSVRFYILTSAWHHAEIATEALTAAVLDLVKDHSDHDSDRAAHLASPDRNKPWCPNLLRYRKKTGFDEASLRLLAGTYPAALLGILENLANDDPQKGLLVDLALDSKDPNLAAAMLDRRFSRDDRFDGPVLYDRDSFHKAVASLQGGITGFRPGYSTTFCIPRDADVADVLLLLDESGTESLVKALCDPVVRLRPDWEPTAEDFATLLDSIDPADLARPLAEGMYRMRCLSIPKEDGTPHEASDMSRARQYMDQVADRINADQLCLGQDTLSYVATRLSDIFAADVASFDQAMHLTSVTPRPLGEVLRAVARLTK